MEDGITISEMKQVANIALSVLLELVPGFAVERFRINPSQVLKEGVNRQLAAMVEAYR